MPGNSDHSGSILMIWLCTLLPVPDAFMEVISHRIYRWFNQRNGAANQDTAGHQVTDGERNSKMHYRETRRFLHDLSSLQLLILGTILGIKNNK